MRMLFLEHACADIKASPRIVETHHSSNPHQGI